MMPQAQGRGATPALARLDEKTPAFRSRLLYFPHN
jgi:hypothetical protein